MMPRTLFAARLRSMDFSEPQDDWIIRPDMVNFGRMMAADRAGTILQRRCALMSMLQKLAATLEASGAPTTRVTELSAPTTTGSYPGVRGARR